METGLGQDFSADIRLRREEPFPEDPEKRFEAVFASIGNSEAKCVALLCLSESQISSEDLRMKFLLTTSRAWKISRGVPTAWARQSLVPIGMVAEVDTLSQGSLEYVLGFRLTEAGRKFGQPIAAYLIAESQHLPHSLGEIFGQTATGSGETRAVVNRARVLELMAKQGGGGSMQSHSIAKELGLNVTVVGHALHHFAKLGMADYQSVDDDQKNQYAYSKNPDYRGLPQPYHGSSTLSNYVYEVIRQSNGERLGTDEVVEQLAGIYSTNVNERNLKGAVTVIMSHFAKEGFLVKGIFSRRVKSDARITDYGREVVKKLVLPVRSALAGNEALLEEMRRVPWSKYAADAVARHKENSGQANRRLRTERVEELYGYLLENPGSRPSDIDRAFGKRGSSDMLTDLIRTGKVIKERNGKASRYYPVESTNPSEIPGPIS